MKNKAFLICAVSAFLLTGCTQSNILASGEPAQPNFETQDGIALDWGQIGGDLDDEFTDNEEYPMALSVNYNLDPKTNHMDITLIMKHGATAEDAVEFANAAMRMINDEAAMQDFSYEKSSDTSYGGFFKENDVHLTVMPDYTQNESQYWLVDMDIPKGSDEKIVPKEGAVITEPEAEDEEDGGETEIEEEDTEEAEAETGEAAQ